MSQPISDAAFELIGACIHSLRFAFGAPLHYPYAPAQVTENNPPDVIFRRLQVVSPPPARDGADWQTGLTLDGLPFDPGQHTTRLAEVRHADGVASLDTPDPKYVIADETISVPRQRQTMAFPGGDYGRYLTSISYWTPIPADASAIEKEVEYYDTFRIDWEREPEHPWVAVSFDAFFPPERDSADLIIPLGECDGLCPTT